MALIAERPDPSARSIGKHYLMNMKSAVLTLFFVLSALAAAATDWFPFREVNGKRINLSVNGGYHFENHVAAMGFGVTIYGFHMTIGGVGDCRLKNGASLPDKNNASAMVQAGYQIPVVRAFRFIPVVGTAAAGRTVYDREKKSEDGRPESRLKMNYRFDYGVHFVYNHRKLIVNAAITRYTVFGGVGIEF